MIFKSVQVDGFVKKPDEKIRAVLVYGSNDGLRRDTVKRLAVIIVNDAGNDLTKAIRKMLDESPNTGNLLILSGAGSLNKKSSLVKLAEDSEDMAAVACYEDKNEDICSVLKSMGMTFEPAAVQLLCSRLSGDRMVNLNELEKLATYMGTAKNVTAEIVGKIISDASDAALDDIYYAALGGDKVKALSFYTRYVNEGNEPAAVVRGLTYHLMKLLVCRAGIENGESVDRAMQRLMPRIIFYRTDAFKQQLSYWSRDKLLRALEMLYAAEKDCKTTNMPAAEVVSMLLLRLAAAAKRQG